MSDSSAYDRWVSAGEPFTLARPLAAVRDRLRSYGYTVYDKGDDRHLHHDPPEDHTPYSATGWPLPSPFGVGFAIDIMPPPAGSGLPSLARLGAQLHADRQAGVSGVAWLKYMNWEPDGSAGQCWHDRWQPGYVRTGSSDRGHIHLSGRTDYQTSDVAAGYDPVARARGGIVALSKEDIAAVAKATRDLIYNGDADPAAGSGGEQQAWRKWYNAAEGVADLLARPSVVAGPVDPAAVKAVLLDPDYLAALAKAINDDAASRMAG